MSSERGDQPPVDLDQFGINSPKLSHAVKLGKALPRGDDKHAQANILNLVMTKP